MEFLEKIEKQAADAARELIEISKVSIFLAISMISVLSMPITGRKTGILQAASVHTIAPIVWLAT